MLDFYQYLYLKLALQEDGILATIKFNYRFLSHFCNIQLSPLDKPVRLLAEL